MRPLAVAGATGGFASVLLQSLRDLASHQPLGPALVEPACVCPDCESGFDLVLFGVLDLDIKSLLVGVFIGLALGPLLEVLVLLRQLWILQLRSYLRVPASQRDAARDSYRVLG